MSRNLLVLVSACAVAACSPLEDPSLHPQPTRVEARLPAAPVPFNEDGQLLFGDLHIHTSLSTDAYIMGVRALPEDAYIFARGGQISHGAGYPIRLSRPLDFAAVTDHSEYLGQARLANLRIPTTEEPLGTLLGSGDRLRISLAWLRTTMLIRDNGFSPDGAAIDSAINQSAWQLTIDAAERYYQPGIFTTFIGYEWSADAGDITAHMHRNVIYRGNDVASIPFSSLDSNRPKDLWLFLQDQNRAGKISMAIPHNANFSRGNMYAPRDSEGLPLTASYAAMRSRYEPISEILQIKGSSETHPLLSSEDEFADFELLGESMFVSEESMATVKGSYLRDALRVGMELAQKQGFNPFTYGVIGSSDSHNASSPSQESSYTGKLPMLDGSAGLRTNEALLLPKGINPVTRWSSGGLAGVWAQENTRQSIFDALQRRETFATSGPRISVRFFAGFDYSPAMIGQADVIRRAYTHGVPMGGELGSAPTGKAPGFIVLAAKDPMGANLDRVQLIKAWVDDSGASHEKVFDIAAADGRPADPRTGKLPAAGNTVTIADASYQDSIGGASVAAFWSDPEFDSRQRAFYYVRVLEIPTPRWSTFDAVALGTQPMSPASIQERAITSAIWYIPEENADP
ncbi:MAG: DUF3604 domain-containing protein [Halioglobus sp.]|nr:DUF3604 domain-containing protein [Halioglobus sp.]